MDQILEQVQALTAAVEHLALRVAAQENRPAPAPSVPQGAIAAFPVEPKIPLPEKFSGDRSKFANFRDACQLYGDVLYFYTEYRGGFIHSEMWHPIYFWFYFVFMNALWIIIPSALIVDAWANISRAQGKADSARTTSKSKRN